MSGEQSPHSAVAVQASVRRWQNGALGAGLLALVICLAVGFFVDPDQFFRAYFAAYVFFLGIGLGGMALVMLYHLTGGAWGFLVRRIYEAQMKTLPLLALLFVPVALGVNRLYLWAQPELVAHDVKLQHQQFYLNKTFFLWRAVIYFAIWLVTAWGVAVLSRRQDRTGDPRLPRRLQRLSEIGLVLYGTSLHFAAFDWLETLQPTFHSTIFPLLVAAGQILSAHAFALMLLVCVSLRGEAQAVVSRPALNDLGNLLLSFLIIWAYMVWFQFMLIWIANLPTDVMWFVPRTRGGWQGITWLLFIVQFAVPFCLLLLRSVKRNPNVLVWVAGTIFVMQLIFAYYLVTPSFPATSLLQHGLDCLTPIAIGGVWLGYFLFQLNGRPLLAVHDPSREKALELRRVDDEEVAAEQALAHG